MPYSKPSEAPDYVPEDKRAQWIAVWNSAHAKAKKDGKNDEEAESSAFAQANGVAGPKSEKNMKTVTSDPPEILFAKISSINELRREVTGVAGEEPVDKENEIFDYLASKPELQKWSKKIEEVTDGKSLGNVRLMHENLVAGKVIDLNFDDLNKIVTITSKCLNDDVWNLILEGGLTGYSFGGKKMLLGKDNGARRYKAIPAEVSYVDNPALYGAYFTSIKADGATELRKFAHSESELLNPPTEEKRAILLKWACLDSHEHETIQEAQGCINEHLEKSARSDKSISPGDEPMDAKEKQEFEDLKKSVGELKKMTEAQGAHLQAIKTHHDGMGDHLAALGGDGATKAAAADDLKKVAAAEFVSIGKTADGVEVFKKAAGAVAVVPAPNAEVIELKAKFESLEKVLTGLNEGIQKLFGKKDETVHIPGLAKAVADVTAISKGTDGADPDKEEKLKKVFGSAAEAAKDPEFIKSTLGKPFGNEMELAAASMRKSAAA
jgi:hypothetical protein